MQVLRGLSESFDGGRIGAMMIEVNSTALRRAGTSPKELIAFIRSKKFLVCDIRKPKVALGDLPQGEYLLNVVCTRP